MPMSCPCQIREPGGVSCRLGEYARPEESGIAPSSSLGPSREPERAGEYPSASRDSEHNGRQAPDLCGEGYRRCPRYLRWRQQIAYLQQQAREELALSLSSEEERQRHAPDCPYRVVRQFERILDCQDRRYVLCGGQQGHMASELYAHAYCLAGEYLYLGCHFYEQARKDRCPPEPSRQACGYFDPYANRCLAQEERGVTENWRSLYCLPEAGRMTGFRDCPRYLRRQLSERAFR